MFGEEAARGFSRHGFCAASVVFNAIPNLFPSPPPSSRPLRYITLSTYATHYRHQRLNTLTRYREYQFRSIQMDLLLAKAETRSFAKLKRTRALYSSCIFTLFFASTPSPFLHPRAFLHISSLSGVSARIDARSFVEKFIETITRGVSSRRRRKKKKKIKNPPSWTGLAHQGPPSGGAEMRVCRTKYIGVPGVYYRRLTRAHQPHTL